MKTSGNSSSFEIHNMKEGSNRKTMLLVIGCSLLLPTSSAQIKPDSKKISPDLFGLFFEDINYSADGGLYAKLLQNRSFEYSPTDRREWNFFSVWEYITPGFSYGSLNVETTSPIHPNNPALLDFCISAFCSYFNLNLLLQSRNLTKTLPNITT
jgi:hypothetical protein